MWCAEYKAKVDIPICEIKKGYKITVTKNLKGEYVLWHNSGLYELPCEYIGDLIAIVSKS